MERLRNVTLDNSDGKPKKSKKKNRPVENIKALFSSNNQI